MTALKATIKHCLSQPSGISLFRKKKNMLCYIKAAVNVLWAFHSTITKETLCLRLKTSGEIWCCNATLMFCARLLVLFWLMIIHLFIFFMGLYRCALFLKLASSDNVRENKSSILKMLIDQYASTVVLQLHRMPLNWWLDIHTPYNRP